MAMTYAEQLRHPYWQRKRLEMLQSKDFTCEGCGDKEKTLHVHHKRYVKGRLAWEYTAAELSVLCEDCHEFEHGLREATDEVIMELSVHKAFPLLAGMLEMYRLGKEGHEHSLSESRFAHPQSEREYLVGMVAALLSMPCDQSDVVLRFVGGLMKQMSGGDEFKIIGHRLMAITADLKPSLLKVVDEEASKG